jgi:hypothetical protein
MLKAIFGKALRGYSYKPADKRSKTVSEIVSDLELEGIPLSDLSSRAEISNGTRSKLFGCTSNELPKGFSPTKSLLARAARPWG